MCWRPALSSMPRALFLPTKRTTTPRMCSTRLSADTPTSSCFGSRNRNDDKFSHVAPHAYLRGRTRFGLQGPQGNLRALLAGLMRCTVEVEREEFDTALARIRHEIK